MGCGGCLGTEAVAGFGAGFGVGVDAGAGSGVGAGCAEAIGIALILSRVLKVTYGVAQSTAPKLSLEPSSKTGTALRILATIFLSTFAVPSINPGLSKIRIKSVESLFISLIALFRLIPFALYG